MLLLPLSALCKKINSYFSQRQLFLAQLFVFVFCAHFIIFGLFMVSSTLSKKQDTFSITLTQSGFNYVLMPLLKNVDNIDQINKKRNPSQLKSKIIDYETYQQKKKEQHKKNVKVQSSVQTKNATTKNSPGILKSLPKVIKQTLPVESKASIILRSTSQSMHNKKEKSKKTAQNILKNKKIVHAVSFEITDIQVEYNEPVSQATLEIEPIQQSVPQPVEQSIEQQVITQPVEQQVVTKSVEQSTEQQVAIQSIHNDDSSSHENFLSDDIDMDNVVFVGYQQLENSIISSQIQQEILQHWNPPIGIPAGVTCQLLVHVNGQGKADTIKITKGSGRLVFDVTARKAIDACVFPKEIWNKNNTITLGS
ncbi:MAG TPA: TonB C-terminal domain-containing protein [Candidatus Saccharimonadales bacterium]|nr:TonB C-terminal domain-containing protein [Candidatus Saccharimonadales bacterium]